MALHNVVIAGGTGFIGTALATRLLQQGVHVTVLTRSERSRVAPGATRRLWAPDALDAVGDKCIGWQQQLAHADAVINLAGYPITSRWSAASKRRIESSRLASTRSLVHAIRALQPRERPRALVSGSAVGFYGSYERNGHTFDESAAAADDFLAQLCHKWERAALDGLADVPDTRVVVVRTGIVLEKHGGALQKMLPLFQAFAGGTIGHGQQVVSWIHLQDAVSVFERAARDERMSGAYNATAPHAVTMDELAHSLARALRRPCLLPVPAVALQALYGDGSSVVLRGQRVVPARLLNEARFSFKFDTIDAAMRAIVGAL